MDYIIDTSGLEEGGSVGGGVPVASSSLASKRVVYVGGLAEKATAVGLRAVFIPFGSIRSIDVPMDYAAGKHRGFGFIEYASADDAEEAAFNLDGSDYMGKTLRVSLAQPNQAGKLSSTAGSGASHSADQAIWKSDDWFRSQILEGGEGVGANAESSTSLRDEEAQRDAMALR